MNPHQKNKIDISVSHITLDPNCLNVEDVQTCSASLFLRMMLIICDRLVSIRGRAASIPPLWQTPQQERPTAEQIQGQYHTGPTSLSLQLQPRQSDISADQQGYCYQERKYFDSGDYALSKAGKATDVGVSSIGSEHPLPENIPHLASPGPHPNGAANGTAHAGNGSQGTQSGSPVKESSFLHRETSVDDQENQADRTREQAEGSISPPPPKEGVPIRWQH